MPDASYEVCIDTTNNGACDGTWQPAGQATTLALSALADGSYYWQVRATAGGAHVRQLRRVVVIHRGRSASRAFLQAVAFERHDRPFQHGGADVVGSGGRDWLPGVCRLDKGRQFAGGTNWVPVGLTNRYTLTNQPTGTRYWQIRALAGAAPLALADNGAEFGFTVGGAPPPTFAKLTPANGTSDLGSTVGDGGRDG